MNANETNNTNQLQRFASLVAFVCLPTGDLSKRDIRRLVSENSNII